MSKTSNTILALVTGAKTKIKNFETVDEKLEDTLRTASSKADNILVSMEKKLEELRKKNAKATDEVVEDVKDVDVPTAKA